MSTEIAVGTMAGGVTWARSYAIGSARSRPAAQRDPPSPDDVEAMRAAARAAFAGTDVPPADDAVAVGGSAASLPTIVGAVARRRRARARARAC